MVSIFAAGINDQVRIIFFYNHNTNRYSASICVVKRLYLPCFPLIPVSRKRAKNKSWITKSLKSKNYKHCFYNLSCTVNNAEEYTNQNVFSGRA